MDEMKKKLQQLYETQAELTKESEAILKEYESHDLIQENYTLRIKYEEIKKKTDVLRKKQHDIELENSKLRQALQEQIIDEKLSILKVSEEKLHTYFGETKATNKNKLTKFEQDCHYKINLLEKQATQVLNKEDTAISKHLEEISLELEKKIMQHRERLARNQKDLLDGISGQYNEMASEEVTEAVMQKRMKQNQFELKIGLNWINKIGILLIILGVGAAFRYSYSNWFNDLFKGSLFFAVGIIMLAGGDFFYRKQKRTFAFGLLGGGIAVLYGSIFFSYFLLDIIQLTLALVLSVLVTVTAVVLSLRYQSRTICSFGLIGGYLPLYSYIFSFGLDGTAVYSAMGYLLLLNVSILLISFQRQWSIVHYISFLFNIPSMLLLISLSGSDFISIVYSILTFFLYLGITVGFGFMHKVSLKKVDVILLGFNTFISCSIIYYLFNQLGWDELRGFLAVIFCALYFGLGRFIEMIMPKETQTKVLFYGTSITFAVLVIPFQFGVEWLALGWLVEAVVLMLYANRTKLKALEKAGWMIFLLCLATFSFEIYGNMTGAWILSNTFNLKYFSITFGTMLVTLYYLWQEKQQGTRVIVFNRFKNLILTLKYISLTNLWFYVIYESRYLYYEWVPQDFRLFAFYEMMLVAFLTIGLAYAISKIPMFYDKVVKYYCLFLYGAGGILGLLVTLMIPVIQPEMNQNTAVEYLALGLLIAFNTLLFFTGRDLLIAYIRQEYKNLELYPVILGVYLLGVTAAFLTVQFRLGDVGFVFSSVFLVIAIAYIVYGFQKKYMYIRRLGLGLTLFSTGKLILYDLTFLSETNKIIAYFCFGIALIGISYLYQKVSSNQETASKNSTTLDQ